MESQKPKTAIFKDYLGMALWELRNLKVDKYVSHYSIKKLLDVGCGEGHLINRLSRKEEIQLLVGVDLDLETLHNAEVEVSPEPIQESISFYRENPLQIRLYNLNIMEEIPPEAEGSIEMVTVIEMIEHIEIKDLPRFCETIFGQINAEHVVMTTPNKDFNIFFNFREGQMRHPDHKFEWTRAQFSNFCQEIENKFSYSFDIFGVGEHIDNDSYGFCTQGALFSKKRESVTQKPKAIITQKMPLVKYRYPFWRDNAQKKLNSELINIIGMNNYQPLSTIVSAVLRTNIGKKINAEHAIDGDYIVKIVQEQLRYCGVDEEGLVFYEYE